MLIRCQNKNHIGYKYYGAKGVIVCDRWSPRKGGSFSNFLADMGERPESMTLDRIDSYGNYTLDNTRWATWMEQRANRRKKEYE